MNQILFAGYSAVHPADFTYQFRSESCYLLLLTATPAKFLAEGELREYPAHSAVLFPPCSEVYYQASREEYKNDWIRLVSDEAFITGFPSMGRPFPVADPEYCHQLFRLITWEATEAQNPPNDSPVMPHLLRALFLKLGQDALSKAESPHSKALLALRREITNNPQLDWSVAQMAERLHLSEGYLQSLYKKAFGISCMEDVIESRLRMAEEKLIYTRKSIAEISEECGYRNVEHFCRQCRKNTGLTPSGFRRSVPESSPRLPPAPGLRPRPL